MRWRNSKSELVRKGRVFSSFETFAVFCLLSLHQRPTANIVQANDEKIDATGAVLISTRCRANCLTKLEKYLESLPEGERHRATLLSTCYQDQSCSSCIRPCDLTPGQFISCNNYCQRNDPDCIRTCDFLNDSSKDKPGICPNRQDNDIVAAVCIDSCDSDYSCGVDQKCCSNGCGLSCKDFLPSHIYPPKPDEVLTVEKKNGKSAHLSWIMPSDLEKWKPLIYIIQQKSHIGMLHNEHLMRSWEHVALVVNEQNLHYKEMELGRWYRFRVAAVNANGSAGFTESAAPFKLKREPRDPSHPLNLTEFDSKVQKNGKHQVSIRWLPPKHSDIPVSKYKIYWSCRLEGKQPVSDVKELKKTVQGKITEFVLTDLLPDCVYLVQVQAMIQYGDKKLRSKKSHVFVSTFPDGKKMADKLEAPLEEDFYRSEPLSSLPSSSRSSHSPHHHSSSSSSSFPSHHDAHENEVTEDDDDDAALDVVAPFYKYGVDGGDARIGAGYEDVRAGVDVDDEAPPGVVRNITADLPYFQNGLVKARVSWSPPSDPHTDKVILHWTPDVCIADHTLDSAITKTVTATTRENHFDIFDLRFDCRYVVTVNGMSYSGQFGPPARLSFYVQGCNEVQVIGQMKPSCPAAAPDVPARPQNLTYVVIISNKNINVELSWANPISDRPLKGWRIIWGKRLVHPQHGFRPIFKPYPVLDRKSATPLLLPSEKTRHLIERLDEATDYIVQLQAISDVGDGEMAQLIITTPQLSVGSAEERYPYPRDPDLPFHAAYDPDRESPARKGAERRGNNAADTGATPSRLSVALTCCLVAALNAGWLNGGRRRPLVTLSPFANLEGIR